MQLFLNLQLPKFYQINNVNKKCNLLFSTIFFFLFPQLVNAREIQGFGFLGSNGNLGFEYFNEDDYRGIVDTNNNSSDLGRTTEQARIDLNFYTFIYHPNFIKLDLSLGVVFDDYTYTSVIVDQNGTESQFERENKTTGINYGFRFNFFNQKDYPFSIYLLKQEPELSSTAETGLKLKNTTYGIDAAWNAPVRLLFRTYHQETKGSSLQRIIDEAFDFTSLEANKILANNGFLNVLLNHTVQNSLSTDVPIAGTITTLSKSKNTIDRITYDSVHNFDNNDKKKLTINSFFEQQRDSLEFDSLSFSSVYNWLHNQTLDSIYELSAVKNDYALSRNTSLNLGAGINYRGSTISSVTHGSVTKLDDTGIAVNTASLINSTSYTNNFRSGSFFVSGGLSLNDVDTTVTLNSIFIKELKKLPNSQEETILARKNIIANTIVIQAVKGTSTEYVRDVDYEVIQRGISTFIKMKVGSRFFDEYNLTQGNVSISYNYFPGKDNKYQTSLASLNSRLTLFRNYYTFAEYSDYNLDLKEGELTQFETTKRLRSRYGVGLDASFFDFFLFGASLDYTSMEEDYLSSEGRNDIEYIEFLLFTATSIHLSRSRIITDYTDIRITDSDIDQTRYSVSIKFHPTLNSSLYLVYDDLTDDGRMDRRKTTETKIIFDWRLRKISLRIRGSLYDEQEGTNIRERNSLLVTLNRVF